jgi:hypothetical protein
MAEGGITVALQPMDALFQQLMRDNLVLRAQVEAMTAEKNRLLGRCEQLAADKTAAEEASHAAHADIMRQNDALRVENAVLKSKVADLQLEVDTLRAAVASHQTTIASHEATIASHEATITTLSSACKKMEDDMNVRECSRVIEEWVLREVQGGTTPFKTLGALLTASKSASTSKSFIQANMVLTAANVTLPWVADLDMFKEVLATAKSTANSWCHDRPGAVAAALAAVIADIYSLDATIAPFKDEFAAWLLVRASTT